jgi:type IV secretion system protein VirB10
VVRFRRGLIIGIVGVVSACLVGVTWFALEPPSFRMMTGEEKGDPLRKAPPEALANAPASYGDVPRLGPPLPGDLGRPILEQQRQLAAQQPPQAQPVPDPAAAEAERARAAAEAERQRLAAAEEAARGSGVIVQLRGGATAGGARGAAEPSPPAPGAGETGGAPRQGAAASPADADANPHQLRAAPSPWTLSAGTIIPASLITGLNSDLPGMVLAQVTENVRDSATGRTILIPQGARLIGSYDSVVAFAQRRALLNWQRIIFPDGSSIRLENMPASDLSGYAGVEDDVDFHTWRLLTGIALSTLLGVGTELSLGSGEGDLVRAVRESTQQNASRAGDQVSQRNLDVRPTLTVRPGWPLRAIIHRDLVLRPWRG